LDCDGALRDAFLRQVRNATASSKAAHAQHQGDRDPGANRWMSVRLGDSERLSRVVHDCLVFDVGDRGCAT
jgi:hypothetical protein